MDGHGRETGGLEPQPDHVTHVDPVLIVELEADDRFAGPPWIRGPALQDLPPIHGVTVASRRVCAWALFRGFLYAISFMAVAGALGLIESAWGLLALPGAVVIGFAFAGVGVAATTFMRTWQDFELIGLVQLPMFLFSATFFPITTYPSAIQWVVRFSPLYHAVQLLRALNLGTVGWAQLVNVGYLLVLGACGLFVAQRRIGKLLLK